MLACPTGGVDQYFNGLLTFELTLTAEAGRLARAAHDDACALRGQGGLP